AGGVTNPLGARAMYLSGSFYRIHGTNAPGSIGSRATAGCIRMANQDVLDLYDPLNVGTKGGVFPPAQPRAAARVCLVPSIPSPAEIALFVTAITSVRPRPPYLPYQGGLDGFQIPPIPELS